MMLPVCQHTMNRMVCGLGSDPNPPETLALTRSQALKLRKAVPALNDLYKAGGGYRHNREGASTEQYEAQLLRVRRDLQELLRIVIEHDDRAVQDIPRAFRRTRQDEPSEVGLLPSTLNPQPLHAARHPPARLPAHPARRAVGGGSPSLNPKPPIPTRCRTPRAPSSGAPGTMSHRRWVSFPQTLNPNAMRAARHPLRAFRRTRHDEPLEVRARRTCQSTCTFQRPC